MALRTEVRGQALLPFPAHCDKELTHHLSLWARGPTDSHKARASWDGIHPILTLTPFSPSVTSTQWVTLKKLKVHTASPTSIPLDVSQCFALFGL